LDSPSFCVQGVILMCGIIGMCGSCSGEARDIMISLIHESKIRGLHSFGIAYYDTKGMVQVRKWSKLEHVKLPDFSDHLIFHNRYSTSGDWNDPRNNQPVRYGDVALALNGVITMADKADWPDVGVPMATENDAELLAALIHNGVYPVHAMRQLGGSIAAVFLHSKRVWAMRNNSRPLHWFMAAGSVFVVSTKDIVTRATSVPVKEVHTLTPYSLMDLESCVWI
jgi:glutamine phosphoribosylpyrophosphate amidotransferase